MRSALLAMLVVGSTLVVAVPALADGDNNGAGGEGCEGKRCVFSAPHPDLGSGLVGGVILALGLLVATRRKA